MRIFLTIIAVHLLLIALVVAGMGVWSWKEIQGPGPLAETKLIEIPRGYGVSLIADKLNREGIIDQPLLFRFAARLHDKESTLKAGEYEIPPHISMTALLELLESNAIYQRRFTIPEGLTSWQIVQLLNMQDNLSGEITDIPAEGALLPETYNYQKDESRQAVLSRLGHAMKTLENELCKTTKKNEGGEIKSTNHEKCWPAPLKNWQEVIILASIIEKETGVASERNQIAGVFINRLRRGIALQTDPTVIYALTKGQIEDKGKGPLGRRLLRKDLAFDSPYNTYKYSGLPPGPIANPGRAAIEATLHPESHDFIYFVADGSGGHAFAKTLNGHNRNVAQWRKIRKNSP